MTHTIESLCALIGPDGKPVSDEAGKKLRIWTAEADEWKEIKRRSRNLNINENGVCLRGTRDSGSEKTYEFIPEYTTSLDAIFAAEERAGIHNGSLLVKHIWKYFAQAAKIAVGIFEPEYTLSFLTPTLRLVPFILTQQWMEGQKP